MASLTWWTWVWVNSGSWWWTGRPAVLRFMGSQRVGYDWVTELNWNDKEKFTSVILLFGFYMPDIIFCSLFLAFGVQVFWKAPLEFFTLKLHPICRLVESRFFTILNIPIHDIFLHLFNFCFLIYCSSFKTLLEGLACHLLL